MALAGKGTNRQGPRDQFARPLDHDRQTGAGRLSELHGTISNISNCDTTHDFGSLDSYRRQRGAHSVPARLIGEQLTVRLYAERVELHHGQQLGRIDYRHVVHALLRKPGAFAQYRYRAEMFPMAVFRKAYDRLCAWPAARTWNSCGRRSAQRARSWSRPASWAPWSSASRNGIALARFRRVVRGSCVSLG